MVTVEKMTRDDGSHYSEYRGLHQDPRPTNNLAIGDIFVEIDSGKQWKWTGTIWDRLEWGPAMTPTEYTKLANSIANSGIGYTDTADHKIDSKYLNIVDNLTSAGSSNPLSANQGKILNDRINNLGALGRYLALWDCVTGKPTTNPSEIPYAYKAGDHYVVSIVGTGTKLIPSGSSYTGAASATTSTADISTGDVFFYDGTSWALQVNHAGGSVQDVQINGTSIVSSGVANILKAPGVDYTTSAPTAANTEGLKFAVLTSEPDTKYAGWLYYITEE